MSSNAHADAQGFAFTRTSYLRSGWNVMDFTILVISVLDLAGLLSGRFWHTQYEQKCSFSNSFHIGCVDAATALVVVLVASFSILYRYSVKIGMNNADL